MKLSVEKNIKNMDVQDAQDKQDGTLLPRPRRRRSIEKDD